MPPSRLLELSPCVLVLLALACGSSKSAPRVDKSQREIILSTRYDDRRAGEDAAQSVAAELGLLNDPAITEYVQEIGRRLLRGSPERSFDYQFAVVDQFEPNAFALPGGYIYISRGLLALVNSEDELANVIGHEITHAAARHAAAQQEVARRQSPFVMPSLRVANLASYARDQERDADRGGQMLAARAGYDPMGMAEFLDNLSNVERLRIGYSRLPRFYDIHPGTTERVATNAARAGEIAWQRDPSTESARDAHLKRIDGIVLGANPAEGIFRAMRFLHPDLDFQLLFPEGWQPTNTHRAVGARSPKGDAVIFLVAEGRARDPERAARELLAEAGTRHRLTVLRSQRMKIGHLDAHRLHVEGFMGNQAVSAQLTFIPYRGVMYRIVGVAPRRVASEYMGRTGNTARSFRPLAEEERNSVQITRLRVVKALPGEDLTTLGERAGNAWDPLRTAVLNGLLGDERFEGGEPIKIAQTEAYRPTARPENGVSPVPAPGGEMLSPGRR